MQIPFLMHYGIVQIEIVFILIKPSLFNHNRLLLTFTIRILKITILEKGIGIKSQKTMQTS